LPFKANKINAVTLLMKFKIRALAEDDTKLKPKIFINPKTRKEPVPGPKKPS